MKQKITFLSILFTCCISFSNAQDVKGLYVNNFVNIVGDITAEDDLLIQAQANGYNYLILYNLYSIHTTLFDITDPVASLPLANFIEKARTIYGITQVAGVGETYSSFDNIHDYNLDHAGTPNQQLDHYNIEFEFWNNTSTGPGGYYCTTYLEPLGLPCDTSGAFTFLIDNLCDLHTLCNGFADIDSEMYIGWPNAGQAEQIGDCTDRVLVHYYRGSDVYMTGNSIYNYGSDRLPDLAESTDVSVVMPIFNCKPSFMGPWLDTHPEDQAFDTWMDGLNGYNDDAGTWKSNTLVDGHVWYRYTCMPPGALPVELVYFSVRKLKDANLLNWQIELVENLVKIEIERSTQANKSDFKRINSITNPYGIYSTYKDEDFKVGINLYRLKFIYADGLFDYSKTISVDNQAEKLYAQWLTNEGESFISIQSSINQSAQIRGFTSNGQEMTSYPLQLNIGDNSMILNTNNWPSGLYFIEITTKSERQTIKITVQSH